MLFKFNKYQKLLSGPLTGVYYNCPSTFNLLNFSVFMSALTQRDERPPIFCVNGIKLQNLFPNIIYINSCVFSWSTQLNTVPIFLHQFKRRSIIQRFIKPISIHICDSAVSSFVPDKPNYHILTNTAITYFDDQFFEVDSEVSKNSYKVGQLEIESRVGFCATFVTKHKIKKQTDMALYSLEAILEKETQYRFQFDIKFYVDYETFKTNLVIESKSNIDMQTFADVVQGLRSLFHFIISLQIPVIVSDIVELVKVFSNTPQYNSLPNISKYLLSKLTSRKTEKYPENMRHPLTELLAFCTINKLSCTSDERKKLLGELFTRVKDIKELPIQYQV